MVSVADVVGARDVMQFFSKKFAIQLMSEPPSVLWMPPTLWESGSSNVFVTSLCRMRHNLPMAIECRSSKAP